MGIAQARPRRLKRFTGRKRASWGSFWDGEGAMRARDGHSSSLCLGQPVLLPSSRLLCSPRDGVPATLRLFVSPTLAAGSFGGHGPALLPTTAVSGPWSAAMGHRGPVCSQGSPGSAVDGAGILGKASGLAGKIGRFDWNAGPLEGTIGGTGTCGWRGWLALGCQAVSACRWFSPRGPERFAVPVGLLHPA